MEAPADRAPVFSRTDLRVVFLLVLGYSCAYLGRLDMGASILPMSRALGWSNETLGSVVSCFFVAHAGGWTPVFAMLVASGVAGLAFSLLPLRVERRVAAVAGGRASV